MHSRNHDDSKLVLLARWLPGAFALLLLVGCRTQSTAMSNPFLSPDRVPPPATRTLLPGTAQPYYPGDPLPNGSAIGTPPVGFDPNAIQQAAPTFSPQPTDVVPPGGWNTQPQALPGDSLPGNVVPPNNMIPYGTQGSIQVQPDQQALRLAQTTPAYQAPDSPNATPATAVLPTPQLSVSPYPNQLATYQAPIQEPQVSQISVPSAQTRDVRIRAISSENLPGSNGQPTVANPSRDGFRPQGSSQVRKPLLIDRLTAHRKPPVSKIEAVERFGHAEGYQWLRGELQFEAGQWSLRYAPHQGETDDFGGSLPIANPQVLGDLQAGDYVQLRGCLDNLSPAYVVSVVQRQRI